MRKKIGVFAIILAVACKTGQPVNECDDFNAFFKRFASDSVFQKQHVDEMVVHYYSDEDFPLDVLETTLDQENHEFIDLTTDSEKYNLSIVQKKDCVIYTRRMRDQFKLPLIYKFAHKDSCWLLVETHDLTD